MDFFAHRAAEWYKKHVEVRSEVIDQVAYRPVLLSSERRYYSGLRNRQKSVPPYRGRASKMIVTRLIIGS